MMTLRQIRHFIAVAETGSISAAAQTAFISQSTRTLAIRYWGEKDDPGYKRLLAMLRFFNGPMRVKVYLGTSRTGHELPADCWIEPDDKILQEIARRYGMPNLALL